MREAEAKMSREFKLPHIHTQPELSGPHEDPVGNCVCFRMCMPQNLVCDQIHRVHPTMGPRLELEKIHLLSQLFIKFL